jgi:hypothetical protein
MRPSLPATRLPAKAGIFGPGRMRITELHPDPAYERVLLAEAWLAA